MPSLGSNFIARWVAIEAAERRGEEAGPGADAESEVEESIPGQRRSRRTADKVRAAIAEAMGVELDEAPDIDYGDMDAVGDVIANDLTEPRSAWQALDVALNAARYDERSATDEEVRQAERTVERIEQTVERAARGESDRRYVLRAQAWREEHGLPRKRRHKAPSQQPEGRRAAYIRRKARQLGVSVEEAAAMTKHVRSHRDNADNQPAD